MENAYRAAATAFAPGFPPPDFVAHWRLNSAIAASSCRSDSASNYFDCSIFARSSGIWSRMKVRKPFSHSATSSRFTASRCPRVPA